MVTFAKTAHGLRPGPVIVGRAFVETRLGGASDRLETLAAREGEASSVLFLAIRGTYVVALDSGETALVPENHGLVVAVARAVRVTIAPGEADAYVWSLSCPELAESFAERCGNRSRTFPCRDLSRALVRDATEPAALSRALRVVAEGLVQSPGIDLAQHPPIEDPGTALVVARLKARERLTLRSAAEGAGYSHFHFSRRFRELTGYGFHELVDRVRTSGVLNRLAEPGTLADLASSTGFPSVKAMQESVLDYTGLSLRELQDAWSPRRESNP